MDEFEIFWRLRQSIVPSLDYVKGYDIIGAVQQHLENLIEKGIKPEDVDIMKVEVAEE